MNLTERARLHGVHPQTAYWWFREGTLPVPAVRVNTELAETALPAHGRRLVALDPDEAEDGLVRESPEVTG